MMDQQSKIFQSAVFLDRDGTLIEDRGNLSRPEQVVFYPDTFSALKKLQEHYLLIIVTNQRGISDGEIGREDADRVNAYVVQELEKKGIRITEVYVCPHKREEGCDCIKPKPYFLYQAAEKYHIDLKKSFSVGDHLHDVTFAENAGGKGIFVLTGHGEKHSADLTEDVTVVPGIREVAEFILSTGK